MEHGNHFVDIVNQQGMVVDQKRRRDINKHNDVYHSVHIFLITPWGEVVLGRIPSRTDFPNLYSHTLGTPVATIKRSSESADRAALRALSRELFIDGAEIYHLDDKFFVFDDKHQSYISTYYLIGTPPRTYSKIDIDSFTVLTPVALNQELQTKTANFAPSFRSLWKTYQQELPL
jgi:hypothetical protein